MSTDLDDRLRGLFSDLAEATPVATPSRFQPERIAYADRAPDRGRRAKRLVLAGVAAAVIVIVGLIGIYVRDDTAKVTTAAIPSTDPVLWVPDTSSGKITAYEQADPGPINQGAVRAPDGTVFDISLNANSGDAGTAGEERQIGGHTVRLATDASATGVVYRSIALGCSNLGVTSAEEDPWSSNAVALLQGVAVVDGTVRLALPLGWISLGAAPAGHQFGTSFDVTVDGRKQTLSMWQMPDAPVGFYLRVGQGKPQPVEVAGRQGWTFDSASSPGYTTLVAERDGTAFFIAGPVPASQLIEIAEGMVRAPQVDWTSHKDPNMSNATMAPAPAGCQLPALEILSNP